MIVRFAFTLVLLAVGTTSSALADPTPQATSAPVSGTTLPGGISLPPSITNNPIFQSVLETVTGAATRSLGLDPNWSQGRVMYFNRFQMQIETVPNKYRQIHLHQGTIINPRGTALTPGMRVQVSGVHQADGSLNANEITVTS
jgi:hypothetical protein